MSQELSQLSFLLSSQERSAREDETKALGKQNPLEPVLKHKWTCKETPAVEQASHHLTQLWKDNWVWGSNYYNFNHVKTTQLLPMFHLYTASIG